MPDRGCQVELALARRKLLHFINLDARITRRAGRWAQARAREVAVLILHGLYCSGSGRCYGSAGPRKKRNYLVLYLYELQGIGEDCRWGIFNVLLSAEKLCICCSPPFITKIAGGGSLS